MVFCGRQHRLGTTLLLVAAAAAFGAGDAGKAGPDVERLSADLQSTSFSVRQEAMERLLALDPGQLSEVERALAETADLEATSRLVVVAQHLFLKRETPLEGQVGILGIALNPEVIRDAKDEPQMAITVLDTQPGYPAAEVLRAGDRLVAVGGKAFALEMTIDDFRRLVNATEPGRTLRFTVLRGGKSQEISVTVAGLDAGGVAMISETMAVRKSRAEAYVRRLRNKSGLIVLARGMHVPDGLPELPPGFEEQLRQMR